MKKNLEYIIFACIFYEYSFYCQVQENIFTELNGYYEILKELYNKQANINREYFRTVLKSRKIDDYNLDIILDSLENEDENFNFYLEEYLKKYNYNKIKILSTQLQQKEINLEEFVSKIQDNVVVNFEGSQSLYDIYNQEGFDNPYKTVKIGIKYFDDYENGFRNGEFILIAARTSKGKTSYLKQITINVLESDYIPGIYSLETTDNRITKDILSAKTNISKRKYASGNIDLLDKEKINNMKKSYQEKAKRCYIYYKRGVDIDQLCNLIRLDKKNKKIDIAFIDYVQIIRAYGLEKKDLRLKINYISDRLQGLAGELDIPIVVMAQLNRKAEERQHPILNDLKESGKLEEDADVVILLSIEKWIDEQMKTECILRCNVAKNRNGATGSYFTKFDRVTGYMTDCQYTSQ